MILLLNRRFGMMYICTHAGNADQPLPLSYVMHAR